MQGLILRNAVKPEAQLAAALAEKSSVDILGQIGPLLVRLAAGDEELRAAQKLRYDVFFREMGASHADPSAMEERDSDRFDAVCDHLLVIDTTLPGTTCQQIVGTYRMLPQDVAGAAGGFYSEDEFELGGLVSRHQGRRFLELGRSCVLPAYRSKRTIELLWQGIWAYCRKRDIDVMTGCASFPGTVPAAHAEALSFLHHFARSEGAWAVRARDDRFSSMDLMPAEAINMKAALAAMPPLIKGYLRLGARFGEGCVIDRHFGTTDVLVVLPVEAISQRYLAHFGAEAERFAA
ncbi:GNAT family N-acetyltransferase [Nitratireductor basaltis]|uniref:L-ornithine N(alpha)-acyltransferase n=1 Tax=Nitratireductor basaltis TaxID=472175 RepID=A0A084UEM4_9HYPH|nr:GNAT family N-acetyltransferase [Nitratireductor basaltis]KFB11410.1 Ornithine-acyl[acyl carrier protein] N-acyltransferase [Nitratireductor basaltis]